MTQLPQLDSGKHKKKLKYMMQSQEPVVYFMVSFWQSNRNYIYIYIILLY